MSGPSARLEAEVERVLACTARPDPTRLDELLTDCVARAMSLRAQMLRTARELAALDSAGSTESASFRPELLARHDRLAAAWERANELIRRVRAHREELVRGRSAAR